MEQYAQFCSDCLLDLRDRQSGQACDTAWQVNNISSNCRPNSSSRDGSNLRCRVNSSSLLTWIIILHAFHCFIGTEAANHAPTGPPCVACDDCITSSCLRVCVPSCKTAAVAEGSSMSVEQCKHKGQEASLDIATAACKLSQAACQVSTKAPMQFQSVGTVSSSQCAALANAGCQKMASAAPYSPCGAQLYFGHRLCSGRQFNSIYKVKVNQLCLAAMHALG